MDSSCDIASGSSMVTVNADCSIDILELCNGVMQCDDCADETFETCNSFDCIGSKLKHSLNRCIYIHSGESASSCPNVMESSMVDTSVKWYFNNENYDLIIPRF